MRILRPLLRTPLAWRLSGLFWWSATWATKGRPLNRQDYLANCRDNARHIDEGLRGDDSVLDFGCGLGGVTLAIARTAGQVVGLDVNPLYIRWARKVGAAQANCEFVTYDGGRLPFADGSFSFVYSWAVFERLPRDTVETYIADLRRLLAPGGRTTLYFLSGKARDTAFVDLLGEGAYVYWRREGLLAMHKRAGLTIETIVERECDWLVTARRASGLDRPG